MFSLHVLSYWVMVCSFDKNKNYTSIRRSIRNQICVTLPSTFIFLQWYPITYDNLYSIVSLPILIICGDIYFYLSHRPLHTKYLWHLHKSHHQGTVCMSKALDADIVEHLFGNLGSFAAGFLFLYYFNFTVNIYVIYFWTVFATINTCLSHSVNTKYDAGIHHIHHKLLKYNFGTGLYLMDRMMGSYKQ